MLLGDEYLKPEHLPHFKKKNKKIKLPDHLKTVDNLKTIPEIHDQGHNGSNEAMGGVSTVYGPT